MINVFITIKRALLLDDRKMFLKVFRFNYEECELETTQITKTFQKTVGGFFFLSGSYFEVSSLKRKMFICTEIIIIIKKKMIHFSCFN